MTRRDAFFGLLLSSTILASAAFTADVVVEDLLVCDRDRWYCTTTENARIISPSNPAKPVQVLGNGALLYEATDAVVLKPGFSVTQLVDGGEFHARIVEQPCVQGFADIHEHMMAEYGFGGGLLWGSVTGPEPLALASCDGVSHARTCLGPGDAALSAFPGAHGDTGVHTDKTSGYPNYDYWPRWDSTSHQQVWEGHLKQAWTGGLRLLVMSAVSFEPLCDMSFNKQYGCSDMEAVDRQVAATFAFAANNPTWVEVALSAAQARQIVASGKLAIVLAIEASNVFGDTSRTVCDWMDEYYAKGIRSIQPVHQLNNRFAGVGPFHLIFQIFQHLADNVVTDNVNVDFEYCAGFQTFLQQLILSGGEILATPCFGFACRQYVVNTSSFVGPCLPCDASQGIINTYGLTQDGERLICEMMRRGMLIDVAHVGEYSARQIFEILKTHLYYPFHLSHGLFRGIVKEPREKEEKPTPDWMADLVKQTGGVHGIVAGGHVVKTLPFGSVDNDCAGSSRSFAQIYEYGTRHLKIPTLLGVDFHAPIPHVRPRFGGPDDLGPCGGIEHELGGDDHDKAFHEDYTRWQQAQQALKTDGSQLGVGSQYDVDGLAHIGLLPDFLDDLELVGLDAQVLREWSAEQYIRMWERAERISQELKTLNLLPASCCP